MTPRVATFDLFLADSRAPSSDPSALEAAVQRLGLAARADLPGRRLRVSYAEPRALLAIEDPGIQEDVLQQVIRLGLNVRDTERLAQRAMSAERRRPVIE